MLSIERRKRRIGARPLAASASNRPPARKICLGNAAGHIERTMLIEKCFNLDRIMLVPILSRCMPGSTKIPARSGN
jgi:hypothetical protein